MARPSCNARRKPLAVTTGHAHKVRIIAKAGAQQLFTVGYDGQTTRTERGIRPKVEADVFWASNFGFGIIRHAFNPSVSARSAAGTSAATMTSCG